ncbi:MAG: hypothetical protein ACR2JW_11495 [Thermomicrobiales bacterium]
MLPQGIRFKAGKLFPNLRSVILDDHTTPQMFFPYIARRERRAKDDTTRRDIFGFAEWCLRRHETDVHEAALQAFFAQLFDERFGDWSDIVTWLSPFVIERAWPLWEGRLSSEDRTKLESIIANRSEVRYQPIALITQTTEANFPRRPPLHDLQVRLSMQVECPTTYGSGLGISYDFHDRFPEEWDLELDTFISEAIKHSWVDFQEPAFYQNGIEFHIDLLSLRPDVEATTDERDVREVGEILYALTTSLVTSLCQGLLTFNLVTHDERRDRVSDWVMQLAARKRDSLGS